MQRSICRFRLSRLVVAGAAVAAALMPGALAAHADAGTTYGPAQYGVGPVGPASTVDPYNVINTDPATGRVTLARAYPIPGTFSCAGAGPYANWTVSHAVTGPVSSVAVEVTNTLTDDFTFVRIALTDVAPDGSSQAIGFKEVQGPIVSLDQTFTLLNTANSSEFWQQPEVGHTLVVTFGLNESSACLPAQNADLGTANFSSVTIS